VIPSAGSATWKTPVAPLHRPFSSESICSGQFLDGRPIIDIGLRIGVQNRVRLVVPVDM